LPAPAIMYHGQIRRKNGKIIVGGNIVLPAVCCFFSDSEGGPVKIRIPRLIKEFCGALRLPFSYDLTRNLYIWFGFFWGMPIPLLSLFVHSRYSESSSVLSFWAAAVSEPLHWFFLAHPFVFAILFGVMGTIRHEKDQEIKRIMAKLEELSTLDPLTGLKNRRAFSAIFTEECSRSTRHREPLALLFLDIDHFKEINDTHGHQTGDQVLQALSRFFQEKCRPYDTIGRWGGEEFVILLRSTDEVAAKFFAQRIRLGVSSVVSRSFPFQFTISIGLAQCRDQDTLEELTNRADQALYHAKETGRNKVVAYSELTAVNPVDK
jgi:diguanylate cyclase (GGDEF)-like protein